MERVKSSVPEGEKLDEGFYLLDLEKNTFKHASTHGIWLLWAFLKKHLEEEPAKQMINGEILAKEVIACFESF